jgi:hypothetical protein
MYINYTHNNFFKFIPFRISIDSVQDMYILYLKQKLLRVTLSNQRIMS